MSKDLTPKQSLFLWKLLTAEADSEREPKMGEAQPQLTPAERAPLVDAGYITLEKRKKGRSSASYVLLTDKAWAWAERTEHVRLLKSNSRVGAEALEGLLHRLIPFLKQKGIPLASLFLPSASVSAAEAPPALEPSTPQARAPGDNSSLDARIERACLELTGGRRKERVSLLALRQKLAAVPRPSLDEALFRLERSRKLVLYREDNTSSLTPADHEAALAVNGAPRHLVYLES